MHDGRMSWYGGRKWSRSGRPDPVYTLSAVALFMAKHSRSVSVSGRSDQSEPAAVTTCCCCNKAPVLRGHCRFTYNRDHLFNGWIFFLTTLIKYDKTCNKTLVSATQHQNTHTLWSWFFFWRRVLLLLLTFILVFLTTVVKNVDISIFFRYWKFKT